MKYKKDFKPFKVGTVFNPIKSGPYKVKLKLKGVTIKYPTRLNLMAIDPSKISPSRNMVYTPGEIVLKVKIYRTVSVKVNDHSKKIKISLSSKRSPLIMHAAILMKKALSFKGGLKITVDNSEEIRHVGFGSSSCLIAAVASAINELYGKPIPAKDLVQYLAQNHGEEIDNNPNLINPVQCIGGSAATGQFEGALLIIVGKSRVIMTMNIPAPYKIIIGIPKDYIEKDSKILLDKELAVMDEFIQCGKKFGPIIAYKILHTLLPAMIEKDLKKIGDVVFDYRFKMGSIKNCSYAYPNLVQLTNRLSFLKIEEVAEILSISSVGPAIVAVSKNIQRCKKAFEKEKLTIYSTEPENEKYQVVERMAK